MAKYDCLHCGRMTEHVSLVQAARRIQRNRKTIKQWVKREWVSFVELPSGRVYLCAECLLKHHGPPSDPSGREKMARKADA
jgi:DNA-directed RNA polymerase subunit RPC12/RpoP